MIRTQIQLDEAQIRALRRVARERGVSVAALIRDGVDLLLAEQGRIQSWDAALNAVGKHRSDGGNVGEDHDRYLDEAFAR